MQIVLMKLFLDFWVSDNEDNFKFLEGIESL